MRAELAAAQKRQADLRSTVESKEGREADITANLSHLQDNLVGVRKELGTPLDSQLTPAEREQVNQLQETIRQLQASAA